jgi:hypothetical protein
MGSALFETYLVELLVYLPLSKDHPKNYSFSNQNRKTAKAESSRMASFAVKSNINKHSRTMSELCHA